jgi:hypothetical protein
MHTPATRPGERDRAVDLAVVGQGVDVVVGGDPLRVAEELSHLRGAVIEAILAKAGTCDIGRPAARAVKRGARASEFAA